jgi:PIN domain nuclease of toxin-antitoxin system
MTSVLADTRAVIGYLCDRTKLSAASLEALVAAERTGRLFVSAITLVEVRLEVGAGNLPQQVWDRLWEAVTDRKRHLTVLPVDAAVAEALGQVARADDSSMSEQLIAATALAHELRLVSGVV